MSSSSPIALQKYSPQVDDRRCQLTSSFLLTTSRTYGAGRCCPLGEARPPELDVRVGPVGLPPLPAEDGREGPPVDPRPRRSANEDILYFIVSVVRMIEDNVQTASVLLDRVHRSRSIRSTLDMDGYGRH